MVKKILNWIVYSSENPEKLSLTLMGIVTFLTPYIIQLSNLGYIHIAGITGADASQLGAIIVGVITAVVSAAGGIMTLIGLVRKIVYTTV